MQILILSFVLTKDLKQVTLVSELFHILAEDLQLWKNLCLHSFLALAQEQPQYFQKTSRKEEGNEKGKERETKTNYKELCFLKKHHMLKVPAIIYIPRKFKSMIWFDYNFLQQFKDGVSYKREISKSTSHQFQEYVVRAYSLLDQSYIVGAGERAVVSFIVDAQQRIRLLIETFEEKKHYVYGIPFNKQGSSYKIQCQYLSMEVLKELNIDRYQSIAFIFSYVSSQKQLDNLFLEIFKKQPTTSNVKG